MSIKINRILILGIIISVLFGTSPDWAKHKAQTKKKPAAGQSTAGTKKKTKPASAKKKTVSKKSSSRKQKAVSRRKKAAKTVVAKPPRKIVEHSAVQAADTSLNPDDMPALEDDSEELPNESSSLNASELFEKYIAPNQYAPFSDSVNYREKVIMEIIRFMNTPYKFGGNTAKGIDCSAFTRTVYSNSFSKELPRTAREQFQQGMEVNDKTDLKFGDLVFFNTRRRVRPGHVGIYIGNNLFAHSSSKQGVMVSSLEMDFYSKRFMGGRRVEDLLTNR